MDFEVWREIATEMLSFSTPAVVTVVLYFLLNSVLEVLYPTAISQRVTTPVKVAGIALFILIGLMPYFNLFVLSLLAYKARREHQPV